MLTISQILVSGPTFELTSRQINTSEWEISISNIQYEGNINKWDISYQMNGEEWSNTKEYSFIVKEQGVYNVRLSKKEIVGENNIIVNKVYYFNAELKDTKTQMNNGKAIINLDVLNYDEATQYNNFDIKYEVKMEDNSRFSIETVDVNNGIIQGGSAKKNSLQIEVIANDGVHPRKLEMVTLVVKIIEPYKEEIKFTVGIIPEVYIGLSGFHAITAEECSGFNGQWGTWNSIYSGNNGKLMYNEEKALVLNDTNPVPFLNLDNGNEFKDEYSIYITLKTDDMNQAGQKGNGEDAFGYTIAAINDSSDTGGDYLSWICIYKNWLQVYSYYRGSVLQDYAKEGIAKVTNQFGTFEVASYDISEYENKMINVQVIGVRNGDTKVYINGKEKEVNDEDGKVRKGFKSGNDEVTATQAMIGDLRPLRNLKFRGLVYDFEMYGYALSESEVMWNWDCTKNKWKY